MPLWPLMKYIALTVVALLAVWFNFVGTSPAQACIGAACPAVQIDAGQSGDLRRALKAAKGGDVLLLGPGDHGGLRLTATDVPGAAPGKPVTLRSADPADPARFSWLALREAAHLRLEDVVFDYTFTRGDDEKIRPFEISGSRDIAITGSLFSGDVATDRSGAKDGFGTSYGLWVRGSSDIEIARNEITTFARGLVVYESTDVRILGNDLHSLRSDGMNFAAVSNLRVEGNHIHDFHRSLDAKDHADMIQFWTAGTKRPNTDIVIRSNVLNVGDGWYTQSIFMRNEVVDRGQAGPEMLYRRIAIEDNVIINAHLHGITLGEADGVSIRNNTLIQQRAAAGGPDKGMLWVPTIRVSSKADNVTITKNIVAGIEGPDDQPGWTVKDNLLIQDRNATRPGYYDDVFVAARTGARTVLQSFAYLPGGPADGTGIGAAGLRLEAEPEVLVALIRAEAAGQQAFRFDASLSRGPKASLAGAAYDWDFGDGATASGREVTHRFAQPGRYTVTLTLRGGDGRTAQSTARVAAQGSDVIRFDSATGVLSSWSFGEATPHPEIPTRRLADGSAVIVLGQGGDEVTSLPPGALRAFFGAQDFDLRLRLRATGADPAGEVLRVHESLIVSVGAIGDLQLRLNTAGGQKEVRVRTGPGRLHDGAWHDVSLRYSAATGQIEIEVDGGLRARGKASGPVRPAGRWGLSLGNPFKKKTFDGELADLTLRANTDGGS